MTAGIPSLKILVLGGEVCPPELVSRWARSGVRLLNTYAPTEATVITPATECCSGCPVTIGKALEGYEVHVLDAEMRPVLEGEKGELYIGGEGLARGYLKQPALTAERFVFGPPMGPLARTRLYRTGDLVRMNPEGDLEFFGRLDDQVKIRGFRIELAEIEAVLLENERIQSASIKAVTRDGQRVSPAYGV